MLIFPDTAPENVEMEDFVAALETLSKGMFR